MLNLWLGFAACSIVITWCGLNLCRYGDAIAEKSGLGRTWVGLVLMATVTSLPELINGASAVILVDAPDLAVGDAIGSCTFNLLILAGLDLADRHVPLSTRAHTGNVLAAGFGIMLISIAALGIAMGSAASLGWFPVWFGPYTPTIFAVYLVSMKLLYDYERRQVALAAAVAQVSEDYAGMTMRRVVVMYTINALLVVGAAVALPHIGEGLARATGLGQTFVGNIFIALTTSLPELVVSITAIRMGAVDLAVGNLLGSNVFNMVVLGLDDMLYSGGPILAHVEPAHLISAVTAIAMSAVASAGLTYRAAEKRAPLALDAAAIVALFCLNAYLLYALRAG